MKSFFRKSVQGSGETSSLRPRPIRPEEFPVFFPPHVREIGTDTFFKRLKDTDFVPSKNDLGFGQKLLIQLIAGVLLTSCLTYLFVAVILLISGSTHADLSVPENNPLALTHLFLLNATLLAVRRLFTEKGDSTSLSLRVRRNFEAATFLLPAFVSSAGITFEVFRLHGKNLICVFREQRYDAAADRCVDLAGESEQWIFLSPALLLYVLGALSFLFIATFTLLSDRQDPSYENQKLLDFYLEDFEQLGRRSSLLTHHSGRSGFLRRVPNVSLLEKDFERAGTEHGTTTVRDFLLEVPNRLTDEESVLALIARFRRRSTYLYVASRLLMGLVLVIVILLIIRARPDMFVEGDEQVIVGLLILFISSLIWLCYLMEQRLTSSSYQFPDSYAMPFLALTFFSLSIVIWIQNSIESYSLLLLTAGLVLGVWFLRRVLLIRSILITAFRPHQVSSEPVGGVWRASLIEACLQHPNAEKTDWRTRAKNWFKRWSLRVLVSEQIPNRTFLEALETLISQRIFVVGLIETQATPDSYRRSR